MCVGDGDYNICVGETSFKPFLLVYEAVKTTETTKWVVGVYGTGHLGEFFYMGRCVLREWVVSGGGLDGYFGEQN